MRSILLPVLMLSALASASCSHVQARQPQAACLPEAPPQPEPAELADCPTGSDLVLCMDEANAMKLIRSIAKLEAYAKEAFLRCGPSEPEKK